MQNLRSTCGGSWEAPRVCFTYASDLNASELFARLTLGAKTLMPSRVVRSISVFQLDNVDDTGAVKRTTFSADIAVVVC